jgi:hypothetical protein
LKRGRNSKKEAEEEWEKGRSFLKKIWRGRGTLRVRENFKKWKMREGDDEWERGRAWGRERENIKTENQKKLDEGEG